MFDQVLVGLDENDGKGPWYFSLNNRRLYVLKRCREEGLLPNNLVRVRVRKPKSANEIERYTVDKCSLDAKLIREKEKATKMNVMATGVGIELLSAANVGSDEESSSNIEHSGDDESSTNLYRRNPFGTSFAYSSENSE